MGNRTDRVWSATLVRRIKFSIRPSPSPISPYFFWRKKNNMFAGLPDSSGGPAPSTASTSTRPSSRRDFEREEEYRAFRDRNNLATKKSREKRAEKARLDQEETKRLQKENQGLREEKQELEERVRNLIQRLEGNEKIIIELREKLQRLQALQEEIHTFRERVSELEVAYLGGCWD